MVPHRQVNSHPISINWKNIILSVITILLTLTANNARATHAMGMDLIYQQLSQDSFLITVAFYRDCQGNAAPNSVALNIKSASCNRNINVTLPRIGSGQETTPVCASLVTRCNGGTFPGSEEYLYQRIVVLPQQCTDWIASSSVCCRNNAITTIQNPGNQNIYVEARINNFNVNSSPKFSNNPVPFVCSNQNYCFNNGAIDPEGDSLVYSLVTPRTDVNAGDTITFKAGYNKFRPLSSTPNISLNPVTGDLCMFPTDSNEIAVLAVLVREYRNGVLVGSIMRDIQLRIIGCPQGNNLPQASGIDSSFSYTKKICANSNLNFQVFSSDLDPTQAITMNWNQGITGATFNISGGTRPIGTFDWTPNNSHIRSQPYCFTVKVSDDNCPFNGQQVFSYCIYVVGVAAIVDSIIDPTCFEQCDGRSTAQIINGIPPFTYQWNDPASQTDARATGLCAGNYTITGTDSTGCTTTTPVVLTDPPQMVATMTSTSTLCSGSDDGAAIVQSVANATLPVAYNWELSAGLQTTDTAFNLTAGTYSVTITDSNNCTIQDSVIVTQPLPVSTNMITVANVSCNGNSDGKAAVSVSGGTPGYTYQWDSLSGFQTGDTATNILAGQHIVTVTDVNNCSTTDTIIITQPNTAINLALSKTDINCHGDSSGSATVIATGGTPPYNYTWDAGTGSQTTATASNLFAGTYSVVVTDLNNCVAYPNIEITQPDTFLVLNPVDSFLQCNGDMNGVIGVEPTGGSVPFTYQWTGAASGQATQYVSGIGAGNYKVTVTDSLGCNDTVTVRLIQAATPLNVLIDRVNVTCNNGRDGKAFVTISGGEPTYDIFWDAGANNQTTDTASDLKAGTYQVMVTDSFGCQVDTSIIITEPPPLLTLTTNSTNVTCFGTSDGKASVVVVGGTPPYSYEWSANAGGQTTDTAFGLTAGVYFVTVFDSNYCVTSPDITIAEPSMALSAAVSSELASCFNGNDGIAYAQGLGGTPPYSYQWNAAAGSQANDTAFNLAAGSYIVSVIDSFNCVFDTSVVVTQPSTPLQITVSSSPSLCFGGNSGEGYAVATGGTPPYSYSWGPGTGVQVNDTAFNLQAGRYGVTAIDDKNCMITDSIDIGEPAEPMVLSTLMFPVKCTEGNDGKAAVEASGGTQPYSYLWSPNTGSQVTDTAFNLQVGTFSVTVTDNNLCDTSISVTVTEPTTLQDSVFVSSSFNGSSIKCFGETNGMATVIASGGTAPYTYLWDSSAVSQTNDTAFNLGEGVYSVLITDNNGCTKSGTVSIGSPDVMSFNVGLLSHVSCFSGKDGRIEVEGVGGTRPFQYAWNTTPPVLDSIVDSLTIGNYMVTITDVNGCQHDTTFTIIQPSTLVLNTVGIDARCHNQNSGKAVANVSGGTTPYNYFWEVAPGVFQIQDTAKNLLTGMYHVLVRDAKNCEVRDSAFVDQPTPLAISTSSNDTVCAFQPVQISVSTTGGVLPYTFNWTPALPNDSIAVVAPEFTENYGIIIQDANGCLSPAGLVTVFVRDFTNDVLDVFSEGDICAGDSTTIYAVHIGQFGDYTYSWKDGKSGLGPFSVQPDSSTYYVFTVNDICQNSIRDSVLVNVFDNPDFILPQIIAQGCSPLEVFFSDTSNTAPNLIYNWQFGDGNGSNKKNPTYTYNDSGFYDVTLTVTSANGCKSSNESSPSKVLVLISPQARFIPDPLVADIRNPVITFNNTTTATNIAKYSWEFGDGDTANTKHAAHTYQDTGTYNVRLTVISTDGCIDVRDVSIEVLPYYTLKIPNAFTPYGDAGSGGRWNAGDLSNRIFYPYTEHPEAVEDYEMLIFNRWGELIFESKDIFTGWNGHYKNKLSPQEVYVYKINLRWENGQQVEQVGDVTLFR